MYSIHFQEIGTLRAQLSWKAVAAYPGHQMLRASAAPLLKPSQTIRLISEMSLIRVMDFLSPMFDHGIFVSDRASLPYSRVFPKPDGLFRAVADIDPDLLKFHRDISGSHV
jgi:hypothetical protein